MHMTKTVYSVYGKDIEGPGLILIFQTKAKANQIKDELNAWALEDPTRNVARDQDPTLTGDKDQWEKSLTMKDEWEARSPIHHLDPKSGAWMYTEFFVHPLTILDEPVVPGLIRIRAARRIAKHWRLWKRLRRIAALAHELGLVPEDVEKEANSV